MDKATPMDGSRVGGLTPPRIARGQVWRNCASGATFDVWSSRPWMVEVVCVAPNGSVVEIAKDRLLRDFELVQEVA